MSKRVSITGNIGSGKSTVARLFEQLGIPVYYADARAKELMVKDLDLRRSIQSEFGNATYDDQGKLDRKYLAQQVVDQPERLAALNALVHPAVARDSQQWHQAYANSHQPPAYTLHEAAITLEIGADTGFDAILVVTAPVEVRLARVMNRDKVAAEYVKKWMARQWPEEKKVARADYLIHNYAHHLLQPQVLAVHRQLTTPA